jgi:biopolymer transport protein ExbD
MAVKIQQSAALSTIPLTPLIDVVFLLLIFFLVATKFAEEDREIDVPLPDASEAMPLTVAPKELFINIDQDGTFVVNGQTLEADELEQVLVRAVANNPVNQSVVIRSHKRAPVEYAVTAINLCKRAGIQDYMMNTSSEGN